MKFDHHLEECKTHFNEPILTDMGLGRVVSSGEDEYNTYIGIEYPASYISQIMDTENRNIIYHIMNGKGYYYLSSLDRQNVSYRAIGDESVASSDLTHLSDMLTRRGVPMRDTLDYMNFSGDTIDNR